ncbi:MAG TPA: MMPL family transporter, partial [Myxococcaceae bacterium]|nr:MMPL family transporter [Myxococcaceae bacterium]
MTRAERLVAKVFERRWFLLAAVVAVTAGMAVGASRVGVENRLEVWFLDDDPALASYRAFQDAFGGEETVVVALHRAGGILDGEGQRLVSDASAALRAIPEVLEVRSLASAGGGIGSPESGGAAPERLLADARVAKRLVSADGETALFFVRLRALADLDSRRPQILRSIEDRLHATGAPYFLAGSGVLYDALNRAATVDSGAVLGAAYVLMVLLLWAIYRRILPALVTVGAVVVAVVWTMGAMGFAGRHLNVVTLVVPTLVLIIGVSDCIHILQRVAAEPASGSRRERVVRGVAAVLWPCLFNTVTSVLAFLSLLTSPMAVIRDLGLFCAVGLVFAFATSVVVCTFALAYAPSEPKRSRSGAFVRAAGALSTAAERRPGWVLGGAAALAVALGWGALQLEADTYALGYLPATHRVRQDSDWIERHVGPYLPLEFVVHAA